MPPWAGCTSGAGRPVARRAGGSRRGRIRRAPAERSAPVRPRNAGTALCRPFPYDAPPRPVSTEGTVTPHSHCAPWRARARSGARRSRRLRQRRRRLGRHRRRGGPRGLHARTSSRPCKQGTLTVATDDPAFPPFPRTMTPPTGAGFEKRGRLRDRRPARLRRRGHRLGGVRATPPPPGARTSTSTSTRSRSPRSAPSRSTSRPRTTPPTRRSSPRRTPRPPTQARSTISRAPRSASRSERPASMRSRRRSRPTPSHRCSMTRTTS